MAASEYGPLHRTLGLSVPVSEALDAAKWRERYAYGVVLGQGSTGALSAVERALRCRPGRASKTALADLEAQQNVVSDTAGQLPDDVIRWHLRTAASELEMRLRMPLGVVICKANPVDEGLQRGVDYDKAVPALPFMQSEQRNWYRIDLPTGVISVERIRTVVFGQTIWEITPDSGMIQLEHPGVSSLHILPVQGSTLLIAMPQMGTLAYGAMQLLDGAPTRLPGVWAVDYTLGPVTKTGEPGQIPAVLAHWIACRAGVMLLSIGGIAASRGLTSASLSIDGLSKSIGLQASAIYGINSALEQRLKEAEESIDWKSLRTYMAGIPVYPYAH